VDQQGWIASLGTFFGGLLGGIGGHKLWGTPRSEALDENRLVVVEGKVSIIESKVTNVENKMTDVETKAETIRRDLAAFLLRETGRRREVETLRELIDEMKSWQEDFRQTQAMQHRENSVMLNGIREEMRRFKTLPGFPEPK